MVTCDIVRATVRDQLAFLEVGDFRFYSTYQHLRRAHGAGWSYITINVVSHSPGTASLAFYLAVQLTDVERKKRALRGATEKIGHYDRTIWCYTVNFGPGSPHWDFPIRGMWSFSEEEEVWSARAEIESFTRKLSLPYVSRHVDPAEIRRTLLEATGRAQNLRPYEEILTIDLVHFGAQRLREDIALLRDRYASLHLDFRCEFESFVSVITKA
jgi:hypothetical protein